MTQAVAMGPSAPAARREAVVAVIGTGSAGRQHLAALEGMPAARAVAVSIHRERRAAVEAEGRWASASLEEVWAQRPTHCIVATETARHVEDACRALEAGAHVLVEKPLARDASEAVQVAASAARAGRGAWVGCVLRFGRALGEVRRRLPSLGALHSVRIECGSYLPDWRPGRAYQASYSAAADQGGVLRDLIHEIDYAGWLLGWPTAVSARLANLGRLGIEADEIAELSWQAPEGPLVSIGLDYLSRPPRRTLQIAGVRGTLVWDAFANRLEQWDASGRVEWWESEETRDDWFRAQAAAFLAAPEAADDRLASIDDGVRALAVCDAARHASTSRAEEPVRS